MPARARRVGEVAHCPPINASERTAPNANDPPLAHTYRSLPVLSIVIIFDEANRHDLWHMSRVTATNIVAPITTPGSTDKHQWNIFVPHGHEVPGFVQVIRPLIRQELAFKPSHLLTASVTKSN